MNQENEIAYVKLLEVECKQLKQEHFSDELDETNSDWIPVKPIVGLWDNEDDSDTDNDEYIAPIIIGNRFAMF